MDLIEDNLNFEHRFWLQILGDHLRFIKSRLDSEEQELLEKTINLQLLADDALEKARENAVDEQELTLNALILTKQIQSLKEEILERNLKGQVKIALSPTFFNHMLNELQEYRLILEYALNNNGEVPMINIIAQHNLWLLDAKGHAAAIMSQLDESEELWREKFKLFKKDFSKLYSKAEEIAGYFRALNPNDIPPTLKQFTLESIDTMKIFILLLAELQELTPNKDVLSIFPELVPDHMIREEFYYLHKLGLHVGDPTKPRVSD